ncbi:hypothetical protein LJR234_003469 [Mesorhizobium amorphae]|uniref:hypothetical protein n=1 Tax=Mesorhizobium amorphae TaxID=71433 RepID=UPI003ECF6A25
MTPMGCASSLKRYWSGECVSRRWRVQPGPVRVQQAPVRVRQAREPARQAPVQPERLQPERVLPERVLPERVRQAHQPSR